MQDILTLIFNFGLLNSRFMVENSGFEEFMVKKSGFEEFMVEKSGVEETGAQFARTPYKAQL